jgi:multidrug efflux pump subunit AcrB
MKDTKQSKLEQLIFNIITSKPKRFIVLLITFLLFIGSILMISPLEIVKAKMLPGKDSDTFSIYVDLPEGSSIKMTKKATTCIAKMLQQEDDVVAVSVFLGEGLPLDFAGMVKGSALKDSQNVAEMMINIRRKHHRTEMSYNMVHRIRPLVQSACSINEANIKFIELPAGPPVLASIVAEIYGGKSFDSRREFSKEIAEVLKKQPTLVDVDTLVDRQTYRYSLSLNNNKVLESGVGLEQIKKMFYVAFEGFEVGIINKNNAENQIPIFLRLDDSRVLDENSIDEIKTKLKELKLMNKNGMMIPMSKFVTITKVKQDPTIISKDLSNMINVIAETDMDSQIYPLLDARTYMLEEMGDKYDVVATDMLNLQFTDKRQAKSLI